MRITARIIYSNKAFGLRTDTDQPRLQRYLKRLHSRSIDRVCLEVRGETKTVPQLRTVHALIAAWQDSGAHSAPEFVVSREGFKLWCKYFYGAEAMRGMSAEEKRNGLKSLADYSKYEAQQFIDALLSAIYQSGAQSTRLDEVIAGMERL